MNTYRPRWPMWFGTGLLMLACADNGNLVAAARGYAGDAGSAGSGVEVPASGGARNTPAGQAGSNVAGARHAAGGDSGGTAQTGGTSQAGSDSGGAAQAGSDSGGAAQTGGTSQAGNDTGGAAQTGGSDAGGAAGAAGATVNPADKGIWHYQWMGDNISFIQIALCDSGQARFLHAATPTDTDPLILAGTYVLLSSPPDRLRASFEDTSDPEQPVREIELTYNSEADTLSRSPASDGYDPTGVRFDPAKRSWFTTYLSCDAPAPQGG